MDLEDPKDLSQDYHGVDCLPKEILNNNQRNTACRICCKQKNKTKNLFQTKIITENLFLYEIYFEVTSLNIREHDELPEYLCNECMNRLIDAFNLKRQAEKASQELKKQLNAKICNERKMKLIKKTGDIDLKQVVDNIRSADMGLKDEGAQDEAFKLSSIEEENFMEEIDELERLLSFDEDSKTSEKEIKLLTESSSVEHKKDSDAAAVNFTKQNTSVNQSKLKHMCQVCSRDFSRKSNLIDHLRLHANLKLFQCKFCDKSFVQLTNYRVHLRTHTKDRPYQCHLCAKSYTQSSSLKIHIRSHTDERNYACDTCVKAFTNSSDLKKHQRLHNPENQFSCEVCGKLFAQKVNMLLHNRRMHNRSEMKLKMQ